MTYVAIKRTPTIYDTCIATGFTKHGLVFRIGVLEKALNPYYIFNIMEAQQLIAIEKANDAAQGFRNRLKFNYEILLPEV